MSEWTNIMNMLIHNFANWLNSIVHNYRGVHLPRGNDAFCPLFQISHPVSERVSDSVENFPNFTFSKNIFSIFIHQNFWWPFFSHQPNIYSFPPTLTNSPCFRQICVFSTYFICFSFTPYFYHEAFMRHTITYWTPLHNHIQVLLNFTGWRDNLSDSYSLMFVVNFCWVRLRVL